MGMVANSTAGLECFLVTESRRDRETIDLLPQCFFCFLFFVLSLFNSIEPLAVYSVEDEMSYCVLEHD